MVDKKKRNKIIAGFAGAGIVASVVGVSTFALWSDSAVVDGANITAGILDVNTLEDESIAYSVSEDVTFDERPIDLATFKAVPGDVIRLDNSFDMALDGENLAAVLDTSTLSEGVLSEAPGAADYLTISSELYNTNGTTDTSDDTLITAEADGTYRFQSLEANSYDRGGVDVPNALDTVADVRAEVTVTFSADTPDQVLQDVDLASFADSGVDLTQVRTGTGFNA